MANSITRIGVSTTEKNKRIKLVTQSTCTLWPRIWLFEQRVIPAMVVVETPLDDGEGMLRGGGVDEGDDMVGGEEMDKGEYVVGIGGVDEGDDITVEGEGIDTGEYIVSGGGVDEEIICNCSGSVKLCKIYMNNVSGYMVF